MQFWREELKAPSTIISLIEGGYVLSLVSLPSVHRACNHQSALVNDEFVSEEVSKLVKNGCVKMVTCQPDICSPLSVVQSSMGKLRLVVNLRYLNQFLWKQRF